MASHFTIIKTDPKGARLGRLVTAHGVVETPAFMPVGTQGTVKAMLPRDLKEMGCQILLGNTYHLYLRPGAELIRKLGGLHRFMSWDGPILTDSGGYQVFSLGAMRKLSEEGVYFQSHLDGSYHLLTPESVVQIQEALGSDIAMVLDECIPHDANREYVRDSTARTIRWAERCLRARSKADQLMFGIIQGGMHKDLREQCVREMTPMPFDGFAVGGLGVGEGEELLHSIAASTAGWLPEATPRYLMGVGRPEDLVNAVRAGFDLFDCVLPTRNGRHGLAFSRFGPINLRNARHAADPRPLDEQSRCAAACDYSRAYLHHLVKANEMLGAMLLSAINLAYYQDLMAGIREAVTARRFENFCREIKDEWGKGDLPAL